MAPPHLHIGKRLSLSEYLEGVLAGDRTVLSRAITLVESTLESDKILAAKLLEEIQPHTGKSIRIGITGVPGVGKSSFIETFGLLLVEKQHKIAVLSIDPSSAKTGGSIMGDKTRMELLSRSDSVYIRPSPSGNALGGVAIATREVRNLCEAAGYDVILIETVGVGQSETAVHSMCDFFTLLLLAGAGDELQGMKRGIMEMADGILITKADGENQHKARLAKLEFANALHLFPAPSSGWLPEVHVCSAIEKTGMNGAWAMILAYQQLMQSSGYWQKKRVDQNLDALHEMIEVHILLNLYKSERNRKLILEAEQKVLGGASAAAAAFFVLKEIEVAR